jgi:DNA processing protein
VELPSARAETLRKSCEHTFALSSMTILDEHIQLLAFCAVDGANWHVIAREAQRPGGVARLATAELVERSKEATATRHALSAAAKGSFERELERVNDEVEKAAVAGARLITVLDDGYPANLRVIFNLPPFLFHFGDLRREDARSVAVVGTRNASKDGLAAAQRMSRRLVDAGVTVVSGLALGVDAAAHEETLAREGRTIAVIGTGILRTYPKENAKLAERIAATGAIVSQFWPTQPPTRYTFPRRNVVTSGISQGTVVIEASRTSGAKMQARLALEHGKQLFLVSRLVTDQAWARGYLERGATEVKHVDDVLSRLRSLEQIDERAAGRLQLALDLV